MCRIRGVGCSVKGLGFRVQSFYGSVLLRLGSEIFDCWVHA